MNSGIFWDALEKLESLGDLRRRKDAIILECEEMDDELGVEREQIEGMK